MTIVHMIAGLPRAGGMSELVPLLATEQVRLGHEVTIVTVGRVVADTARRSENEGVRIIAFPADNPYCFYYSKMMRRCLPAIIAAADVVHVHGCWTFPVWWGCHCAIAFGKTLIRSPHGCLEPERLKISPFRKTLAGLFFERRYFVQSAVILATCGTEATGIERFLTCWSPKVLKSRVTGKKPVIRVVPNGVDLEAFNVTGDIAGLSQHWSECAGKRVVLFLSRLHPIKGADLLVDAWRTVAHEYPKWHLLLAGPDEGGYEVRLRKAVDEAGLSGCVTFCGPLYGEERAKTMASVDLFVLPTKNENFGLVVGEALACGTPVITTKGAPWSELLGSGESELSRRSTISGESVGSTISGESVGSTVSRVSAIGELSESNARRGISQVDASENECKETVNSLKLNALNQLNTLSPAVDRCGWWVDIGVEPLAVALKEAMSLTDEERHGMGENGRKLVERKYRWETVAQEMCAVYEEAFKK